MLINLRNALMAGKKSPLPPGARWVEHLESTGTQWIDTGVKMRNFLSFDALFIPTGNSPGQVYDAIYGVYNSVNINRASLSCIVPADNMGSNYGNRYMDVSKPVPTGNSSYKNKLVVYHQANDSFIVSVEGTTYDYGAYASQQTVESTENIMLFGIRAAALGDRYAKVKVRAFKIFDGSTPLRSFAPIAIGTTGYMLDLVSGEYLPYGNQGTGNFVIGPDTNAPAI